MNFMTIALCLLMGKNSDGGHYQNKGPRTTLKSTLDFDQISSKLQENICYFSMKWKKA
jgi:hypothetical protein